MCVAVTILTAVVGTDDRFREAEIGSQRCIEHILPDAHVPPVQRIAVHDIPRAMLSFTFLVPLNG